MLLKPLILDFSNIQDLFEPGFLRLLAAKKTTYSAINNNQNNAAKLKILKSTNIFLVILMH